jgi:hypothetical protein
MSKCYETIFKYVRRFAARYDTGDSDFADRCVSMAWYWARELPEAPPPWIYARRTVLKVLFGQDMMGCGLASQRDAYNRIPRVPLPPDHGGSKRCNDVSDAVAASEHWQHFVRRLNRTQTMMVSLISEDWGQEGKAIARALNLSRARVTQIRHELQAIAESIQ